MCTFWGLLKKEKGQTFIASVVITFMLLGAVAIAVAVALRGGLLTLHGDAVNTLNNVISGGF